MQTLWLAACIEKAGTIKVMVNLCRGLELQGKKPTGFSGLGGAAISVLPRAKKNRVVKYRLQSILSINASRGWRLIVHNTMNIKLCYEPTCRTSTRGQTPAWAMVFCSSDRQRDFFLSLQLSLKLRLVKLYNPNVPFAQKLQWPWPRACFSVHFSASPARL